MGAFATLCIIVAASTTIDLVNAFEHGDTFVTLNATQAEAVQGATRYLLAGRLARARRRAAASGYAIRAVPNGNELVYLLQPTHRAPPGQATLIVRPAASSSWAFEAPHVPSDRNTDVLGAMLFDQLHARVLLVAGATRCASREQSQCLPSGTPCGGVEPRQSDVAHALDNGFFAMHRAVSAAGLHVVQLHSNRDRMNNGDVLFSDGSRRVVRDSVSNRLARYLRAHGVDARSCNEPSSDVSSAALCGSVNAEAQSMRRLRRPCMQVAGRGHESFLHVEQHHARLTNAGAWSAIFAEALGRVCTMRTCS